MADHRHPALTATLAGGAVLFLAVGARQGFGLFMLPVTQALGIGRGQFAAAVALQYLVWGVVGPLAGVLADRWSAARVLAAAGACYALGYALCGQVASTSAWMWTAGVLIGLGLGGASFGVVHAAVLQAVPPARRGAALGTVGALTALGQFLLLYYTEGTIERWGWRGAMTAHALLVAAIVLLAWPLRSSTSMHVDAVDGDGPRPASVLRQRAFWQLAIGFGCSGLQVMFTMTHLPAYAADIGLRADVAVRALAALSFCSFVGSWVCGRLTDRIDPARLLTSLYIARAGLAAVTLFVPASRLAIVAYFALLGCVWMGTIPVASAYVAQRYGTRHVGALFGAVFLTHQIGGFAGTWLGGVVVDHIGTYRPMWLLIAVLCAAGALLTWPLRERRRLPRR